MPKWTEEDVNNAALGIYARQVDLNSPLLFPNIAQRSFRAATMFYEEMDKRTPKVEDVATDVIRLNINKGLGKIGIIKEVRAATGQGLKEAKETVDKYILEKGYSWDGTQSQWYEKVK